MAVTNQEIEEIANEVISSPAPEFVEIETWSTKLSDEGSELGDVLKVPVYATNLATTFNSDTNNYETEDGGGVEYKNVELTEHLKSTFTIKKQTSRFQMSQMIKSAAVAVAKASSLFNYDLILAANYAANQVVGAAGAFDSDVVADSWNVAQDAEMNTDGRSMILTNPYYTALLKDDALKAWQNSNSTETLRDSLVTRLNDFDVLSSNTLASSAGVAGENLVGFFTDKSALAVATGIPEDPDPETSNLTTFKAIMTGPNGLTMQFRKHTSPANGQVFGTVEMYQGAGVMDATRLVRQVSA